MTGRVGAGRAYGTRRLGTQGKQERGILGRSTMNRERKWRTYDREGREAGRECELSPGYERSRRWWCCLTAMRVPTLVGVSGSGDAR